MDRCAPTTIEAEASSGAIVSVIRQYAADEKPLPPYSSGIVMPRTPSSPMALTASRGKKCAASIFSESR